MIIGSLAEVELRGLPTLPVVYANPQVGPIAVFDFIIQLLALVKLVTTDEFLSLIQLLLLLRAHAPRRCPQFRLPLPPHVLKRLLLHLVLHLRLRQVWGRPQQVVVMAG